jgi:hypothetical protein
LVEFEQHQKDYWKAIDGTRFFKRLLHTKSMDLVTLSFISSSCNSTFQQDVVNSFGEELIEACLAANTEKTILDGLHCCVGLSNCSGSVFFFLQVMDDSSLPLPLRADAVKAFGETKDPFLFAEQVDRCVQLFATFPSEFESISTGLSTRLPLTPALLSKESLVLLLNLLDKKT